MREWGRDRRGVTPVIGVVMMVSIAVVLGAVVAGYAFSQREHLDDPGPAVAFETELVGDGTADEALRITHDGGDAIRANRILVVATEPVDLGSEDHAPSGGYATRGEKLTEGNDQTGVGDTWESGESILVGGVGDLEGITVRIVWNPTEVEKDDAGGEEPSELVGEHSVVLFRHTI